MKKKLLFMVVACAMTLMFGGCDAEKVNTAIDAVGDAAGIDTTDIKVDQEQLDKLQKVADDTVDTASSVAQDEEVRKAVTDLADSILDTAKSAQESAEQESSNEQ